MRKLAAAMLARQKCVNRITCFPNMHDDTRRIIEGEVSYWDRIIAILSA